MIRIDNVDGPVTICDQLSLEHRTSNGWTLLGWFDQTQYEEIKIDCQPKLNEFCVHNQSGSCYSQLGTGKTVEVTKRVFVLCKSLDDRVSELNDLTNDLKLELSGKIKELKGLQSKLEELEAVDEKNVKLRKAIDEIASKGHRIERDIGKLRSHFGAKAVKDVLGES